MFDDILVHFGFGAVQTCVNPVDLKKIMLKSKYLITLVAKIGVDKPRTSLSNFADAYMHHPPPVRFVLTSPRRLLLTRFRFSVVFSADR